MLITGVPGSGKTTLGVQLARALQIPFLARDDVRRGLFFTAGAWGDEPGPVPTRDEGTEAFLRLVEAATALGVSCVAELAVIVDRPSDLERLRTAGECVVIVTRSEHSLERAEARHRQDRLLGRRPVLDALGYASAEDHLAAASERQRSIAESLRTELGAPTLVVDTDGSDEPDLEAILAFVTG